MEFIQNKDGAVINKLKFSVIMPCYNSESYLKAALDSIVHQSYPNWELIAVNDGSKDGTLKILEAYRSEDRRIKIFSKENGGYISAVNLGLGKISGDYFLLMGSDDRLDESLFEKLSQFAHGMEPDCIAFQTMMVENGIETGIDHTTAFQGSVSMLHTSFAEYIQTCPAHAAILSGRDTSKCYKKTLLGELRYFGKYGFDADGVFSMLLCHNAKSFAAIPVVGYYWTLRKDSLSARKSSFAQDCDRIEVWTKFYEHLAALPVEEITSTEKGYLYYFMNIVSHVWGCSRFRREDYARAKRAVIVIKTISRKVWYSMSLPMEDRLLLKSPALWKLYHMLPEWFRNAVKKGRRLIKKV